MNELICYCFGYSEADIEQDVIKNKGISTILERIKAPKKEGFLAVGMAILIPSVSMLAVTIVIIFVVCTLLFFPLLPMVTALLPAIVLAGIVWLIHRLVKRNK